jgi:small nuclear ribonucleoprotein (snRNP)-like protein
MEIAQEDGQRINSYIEELKKFIGKDVTVTDIAGREFRGICRAISFQYLNVVLSTDNEKIIVKNISNICRKRTSPEKKAKGR